LPPQNASRCEPVDVGVCRRFRGDLTQFLHSSIFGYRSDRSCPPEYSRAVTISGNGRSNPCLPAMNRCVASSYGHEICGLPIVSPPHSVWRLRARCILLVKCRNEYRGSSDAAAFLELCSLDTPQASRTLAWRWCRVRVTCTGPPRSSRRDVRVPSRGWVVRPGGFHWGQSHCAFIASQWTRTRLRTGHGVALRRP
jgi:hypothetical protein